VPGLTLAAVFAHNRRHFGARTALTVDGRAATFAQLGRMVDAVRLKLGGRVAPGDRLAIWLPNSAAWVAAFIAATELGAVVVPVNTRLTAGEMRGIADDASARLVLAARRCRGRSYFDEAVAAWDGHGPSIICASDETEPAAWPVWEGRPGPLGDGVPPGLLMIQYTSGTTSRPKGVMLMNDAVLQTAAYVASAQTLTPHSQFLSGSPFFHCSGSMHAVIVCLMAGCALHVMSAWDPGHAAALTQRFGCTASHNLFFRDVLALGGGLREQFASMQVAAAVGTPELLLRVQDEIGIPGISNLYGMTETAGNFAMSYPADSAAQRLSGNGRPQAGNALRIVAPDTGDVLPDGAEGEIQMRGATITPGYFNAAETTRLAFTADGWLRSGDLGRLDETGALTYVARLKDVIRTGGENVSPAEVEDAMLDLPGIQEVCVTAVPHERLDEVPRRTGRR
jgi:acyl-CoA synthetase (AMP-forming)/AMP-acid ligase II